MNSIKEKFDNQGYIVFSSDIESSLIEDARKLTEEIVSYFEKGNPDPFEEYCYPHRVDQGALYDLYARHPEFQRLASHPNLINKLTQIIGPDIFMYENTLVYKPKGKNNEVPWHQDFMNRTDEPTKYVIWVALDDVSIENGALKFIPGSHKLGFQKWFRVKNETHHTRLKLEGVDVDKFEYGIMKAGDILVFHHLVIHGSDLVNSDEPRRAYRFSAQNFEQIYSPRGIPIVLAGGRPTVYSKSRSKKANKNIIKKLINNLGEKLSKF